MALNLPAPDTFDPDNLQYWPNAENPIRVVAPGPVWVAVSTATTGGGGGGASTLDLARVAVLESTTLSLANAVNQFNGGLAGTNAAISSINAATSSIQTRLTTQESRSFGTNEANVTLITAAEQLAPAIGVLPAQITALNATLYQPDDYVRVRFQDTFVTYVSNGTVFSEVPAVRDSVVPTSVVDLQQAVADMNQVIRPWQSGTTARRYIYQINGHRVEIHAISNDSPITANPLLPSSRDHYVLMHGATETPWLPDIAHLYRYPQIVYVMTSTSARRRYMVQNTIVDAAFVTSLQVNPSTLPIPAAYREMSID